jgi:hypothetical protein
MDNVSNQSKVAYEDGPKEVNTKRGLHDGDKQFGKANKMPQDNKGYKERSYPANPTLKRYGEHR